MIAWCLSRLNSKFCQFMAEKESTNPLFSNPLEAYPGLTVSDLNQYLPALENTDDIEMTLDTMRDGVF